jgi:hypothetical protein
VSPCANCKKQLKEVCEDNDLNDVEVVGLHDLLLKVIDFGVPEPRAAENDEAQLNSEQSEAGELHSEAAK